MKLFAGSNTIPAPTRVKVGRKCLIMDVGIFKDVLPSLFGLLVFVFCVFVIIIFLVLSAVAILSVVREFFCEDDSFDEED